eukprot:gene10286-12621_t
MSFKRTVEPIPIKRRNQKAAQIKYKGSFTRDDIKRIAQDQSNKFHRQGVKGTIEIVMPYENNKWRTGKFTEFGQPVALYDPNDYDGIQIDEPDRFNTFVVYALPTNKGIRLGGNSKFNDCLYECLIVVCPNEVKKVFPTPESLKSFLKLKRNDPVHLDMIRTIEDQLPSNIKISVNGDHVYTSLKKDAKKEIKLNLAYGHYSVDTSGRFKVKGDGITEKRPLVYKYLDNEDVKLYNGKGYTTVSKEFLVKDRRNCRSSKYTYIKVNSKDGKSMKETYEDFVRDADILKEATDGNINMYITGESLSKAAIKLFLSMNISIYPDELEQDEAEWIEKASC